MAATRSTAEVFEDHLRLRQQDDFETDLRRNYSPELVMLTCTGVFRGLDGLRACKRDLQRYLPDGEYRFVHRLVEGEVAFLVWTGKSSTGEVHDGVDTFVIRDGRIVVQTIHYSVSKG